MNAKDFFQNGIKDNCYEGLRLADQIETSWQDDIFHDKNRYKENFRKPGIANFLTELYHIIASKKLSDINITEIIFDEEFEANKDQKIFDISGRCFADLKIYTGNIVGSIIYKSHHFNINCRFGNDFLLYMIANASGFLELENFGSIDNQLGIGEWILTYYWKLQLKKAFASGLYKTYHKKKEDLSTVRGRIDINSILKKDYFDGKTVCEFKEHSYKNELNSIISMALTKVFKSKYQVIISDIYTIKNAFDSINTKKIKQIILKSLQNHKIRNPYFKKYNQVFDLSLKILKDEFANVGESKSDFSAFLFDISLLFEHHIRKVLKQEFELFPKNKQEFCIPNGIFQNNIYPDIVIDFCNNEIGVFDVKYKNFDFVNGVARDDRFQIISYVATHMAKYKVIVSGIIYPLRENHWENIKKIKKQTLIIGEKISFRVIFYKVCNKIEDQQQADRDFIYILRASRRCKCCA
jgi:5-methylcytosine-specific restriction enzyme subunit McrC